MTNDLFRVVESFLGETHGHLESGESTIRDVGSGGEGRRPVLVLEQGQQAPLSLVPDEDGQVLRGLFSENGIVHTNWQMHTSSIKSVVQSYARTEVL